MAEKSMADRADVVGPADGMAKESRAVQDQAGGEDGALIEAERRLSSAPLDEDTGAPEPGGLGAVGWARWFWRQLTSMRVALILLLLLSLAAIPGSLVPQESVDPLKVNDFAERHKTLTPIFDKLGLFQVYSSVWFSAIYILLFVSLAGCIIPRSWQFVGTLRAHPPAAPRRLSRLPVYTTWHADAGADEVLATSRRVLRGRRFRVRSQATSVAAEKGYLREAGNLAFHISLFGLLIAVAAGHLWSYSGGKLIVEGDGFANTLTQYDDFSPGPLSAVDDLDAFGFTLDRFDATFAESGSQRGTARTFEAGVTYWTGEGGSEKRSLIKVNEPLEVGGTKVFLIGHGYAPVVTVRDGQGDVAFRGPVPCLPLDGNVTSNCVIKVPDAQGRDGEKNQLAFTGIFAPTAKVTAERGPHSVFPGLGFPAMYLTAYQGDLGINSGISQSVYKLDRTHMKQFKEASGAPLSTMVVPKGTIELPDGEGSLRFDGVRQWASFQISHQPGNGTALASAVIALLGLIGSLFVRRRRVWVRATGREGGGAVVEMAGLARGESARIAEELADIAVRVRTEAPPVQGASAEEGGGASRDGPEHGQAQMDRAQMEGSEVGETVTAQAKTPPAAEQRQGSRSAQKE